MRVVEIKWVDSKSISGWTDKENIDYPCECYSVGIVKEETDDYLTLAVSKNACDQYCELIIVPKCAITKQGEVKVKYGTD